MKSEVKHLFIAILLFIKVNFLPSVNLLSYMFIAMVLDFITGIIKAKVLKQARTSSGYRKTIIKFLQYGGSIAICILLANSSEGKVGESFDKLLQYVNDALLVFIIYIEITSIFENLYAVDKNSMISKYFIAPILKILTWQIRNNPVIKQADELCDKSG